MGTQPHHVLIAMGLAKPKPSPGMPPSARTKMGGPPPPAAPSAPPAPGAPPSAAPQGDAGKMSREDAGFIPAGQRCGGCANFEKQTGDCSAVGGGPFTASDSCANAYQAANGAASPASMGEPDQDDRGTPAVMIATGQ